MTALAAALEALDEYAPPDDASALVKAKLVGLLHGYDARWGSAGYRALFVERTLFAPLMNPTTGKHSRTFNIGGKIDVGVERDNTRSLMDHKFVASATDINDPNAPYWRQQAIDGQFSHYHLLLWQNQEKFDGAILDAIRKPAIAPKRLTKAERAHVVASGDYFGWTVSEDDRVLMQTEDRETPGMYSARLAHDCTKERPDWYFQRRPVPRMDHELLEYATELWDHSQNIISTRRNNRHVRNPGACLLYSSACNFLGICSGYDTPDSDKWRRKLQVHSELPIVEGDGRDVLTNSRIRCYQTCPKKHLFQYEMGIERHDAEEKEALFFGTLGHKALEKWWSYYLIGETNEHSPNHSAGIAEPVGRSS